MNVLQPHSWLWHYLWLAPNVLVFTLGVMMWLRGLHRRFPAFTVFAILSSVGQFAVYAADLSPLISANNFWWVQCAYLVLEGILKAMLVAEIFAHTVGAYSSVAQAGKTFVRSLGALLVFAATVAAAYAPGDSHVPIVSGAHLLEQSIFLIETGLLVFIFLFAAYFKLRMPMPVFGVALGLAVSSCVHLAGWAFIANVAPSDTVRHLIDDIKAGVYHVVVLMWFYYLLVPHKAVQKSTVPVVPVPQHNLEVWNQELERLLHL